MTALKSPIDMFLHWEEHKANEVFMHQPIRREYQTYTWKEAGYEVRRMAAHLQSFGYPKGSHIAIMSKNCAHWLMADMAIWLAGYVSVPLYPNLNAETIRQILEHSECKLLFVGKLDGFAAMKPGIPKMDVIAFPHGMYGTDKEYTDWNDAIAGVEPLQGPANRAQDELATIIYTSGTT